MVLVDKLPALMLLARWGLAASLVTATCLWGADRCGERLLSDQPVHLTWGTSFALWGGHASTAIFLATVTAVMASARQLAQRSSLRSWAGAAAASVVGGSLSAYPAWLAASDLTSGDWIAQQGWSAAASFGGAALLILAVMACAWLSFTLWRSAASRTRTLLVALSMGLGGLAAAGDALLLPGLYPSLHGILYLTAGAAFFVAASYALTFARDPRLGDFGFVLVASVMLIAGVIGWVHIPTQSRATLSLASSYARLALPLFTGVTERPDLRRILGAIASREGASTTGRRDASATQQLTSGREDWNIVFFIVDTLRFDTVKTAREKDAIARDGDTPFLDEWLEDSYRFRFAYSQASRTKASMPPLFRSCEPYEDAIKIGEPLASRFASHGLDPTAVVPQYFLMPVEKEAQALLDGFSNISLFEKDRQHELPERARRAFQTVKDRRFFAWVHFYGMHAPYYAGKLSTEEDGDVRSRYRSALTYLDGQIKEVVQALRDLDLANNTIIFLISDHGENLGENRRTGHGGSVVEEEVHVPLAIVIPGAPGAVIDKTVGNIDIVPTAMDLIGAPPNRLDRGNSLVPLMANPELPWQHTYLVANGNLSMQGIVWGRQKLHYHVKSAMGLRFDLERDARETQNIFGMSPAIDTVLLGSLYRHNPRLFATTLEEADRERLPGLLERLDPDSQRDALEFLLRLAATSRNQANAEAVASLFERARTLDSRALIAAHLAKLAPQRAAKLLASHLEKLPAEAAARLATELSQQRQAAFGLSEVHARLEAAIASGKTETWVPWLMLSAQWPKRGPEWAKTYRRVLEGQPPDEVTLPAMEGIARLVGRARQQALAGTLVQRLVTFTGHRSPEVARRAVDAISALRARTAFETLAIRLEDTRLPIRVRQSILHALVRIDAARAVPIIVRLGDNPLLTVDACEALSRGGDRRALPWLQKVIEQHYNAYTRARAKRALAAIERRHPEARKK